MLFRSLSEDQFTTILRAYKECILKDELKELELNIKKEEQSGNKDKIGELLKRFNEKIQEMNNV